MVFASGRTYKQNAFQDFTAVKNRLCCSSVGFFTVHEEYLMADYELSKSLFPEKFKRQTGIRHPIKLMFPRKAHI